MKKLLCILPLLIASCSWADIPADGSNMFTSDTKSMNLSTNTASPTQILTQDSFITRTWIVNNSSFSILISTVSVGMTSGNGGGFLIPPCVTSTSCQPWSPDGPTVPYWGQLYAVQLGTGPSTTPTISVLREK
jgi:hypothetical protein